MTMRGSGRRRAGKRKGVEREKIGTGNSKNKRSKFWLMRMHQIEILQIFVLIFGKSIFSTFSLDLFDKKVAFSANLWAIQCHGSRKD